MPWLVFPSRSVRVLRAVPHSPQSPKTSPGLLADTPWALLQAPLRVGHPGAVDGVWAESPVTRVYIPVLPLTHLEALGKAGPSVTPFPHLSRGVPHLKNCGREREWMGTGCVNSKRQVREAERV